MLLHADNFNMYGSTVAYMTNGVYAQSSGADLVADPDGVDTARVLRFNDVGGFVRWAMPAANATVGVSVRIWVENLPSDATARPKVAQWRDASNNIVAYCYITPTGQLAFVNGGGPTTAAIATTPGPVLTANAWWHVECKLVAGLLSAATFEARVEGVVALTADTFSTSAATISQAGLASTANGVALVPKTYYKDFVVWDGSGTQNNDFLGSVIVYELFTTSDDTMGGWTSTAANGYSVLDNNPPADGVSYIAADDTPPAAAVFGLTNLPADVTSVKGIITRVRAAKIDGGDGSLQISLRSGVSDDAGTDRPITIAQTYWSDVSEQDPDTAAAWLPGAVDNVKLVIDRTV